MFKELSASKEKDFFEGFVPFKKILEDKTVEEAIKPKLALIEAGESLRTEGKETMTGADLIANLAVMTHILDKTLPFGIDKPDRDISKITKERPVVDFKPVRIYQTTETDLYEEVKETEDYKATSFADSYTELSVKKYGKTFPVSWETMISDTLGELGDLQAKFIRAGKRTIFKQITDLFAGNLSFYNSGNKNIGSGALNEANLSALVQLVANQVDSLGNPLWLKAKYLVVPPSLEVTAKKLVNPLWGVYPTSLDGMSLKFDLEIIVDPDLETVSSTGYYLFCDPMDLTAISHLTLAGHKGIELLMKISDQKALVGALTGELGSFQNDTLMIKGRFFANNALRNPQASAYSPGT